MERKNATRFEWRFHVNDGAGRYGSHRLADLIGHSLHKSSFGSRFSLLLRWLTLLVCAADISM